MDNISDRQDTSFVNTFMTSMNEQNTAGEANYGYKAISMFL